MDPRYKFEQLDSGDNIEFGTSTHTWTDLANKFYEFLLGCGFSLDRQKLSDHYDQCVSYRTASNRSVEQANHAEAYGMEVPDPQTQFANPVPPLKLYEFTVSDDYNRTITEIWHTAQASCTEQIEFECNSGAPSWPAWKLAMVGITPIADTTQYKFEVQVV